MHVTIQKHALGAEKTLDLQPLSSSAPARLLVEKLRELTSG